MNKSFIFYESWWNNIEEVYDGKDEIKCDLYMAILRYGVTGEKTFPVERLFLQQLFSQIDAAQDKRQKRSEAGRKGGQNGTGKAKARYGNKNASKTQANENVNDNDNANANVNVNDNVNGNIYNTSSGLALPEGGQPSEDDEWRDASEYLSV